ncbi:uncharacterized protein LOC119079111 [Bradysia coprophila]|uniref:uncharacterized protein LOC119079111 n=1 Tax=Bradysia coprophila TaxID=38358 RepID=UPI00187DD0ED|nr:uncharacterized protein LOC119079111 [Bradysia coprophila]
MNVICIVTLVIFLAGVELSYGQLLDCLNPLDTHEMTNCAEPNGANGKPIRAWMGPCFDTPTCKIPKCCGIITGRDSLFRIEYIADIDLNNGTFDGNLGAIGIGKAVRGCDKELLAIELPLFQITVPPSLAGYSRTLCEQTQCPQKCGRRYVMDIPFRFVTTVLTTLGLKATFVAQVYNERGEQALCWGLWAELVNADLVESLTKTVTKITSNPLGALLNPFDTLQAPLVGLIGQNEKPFQYPKPCPRQPICRG